MSTTTTTTRSFADWRPESEALDYFELGASEILSLLGRSNSEPLRRRARGHDNDDERTREQVRTTRQRKQQQQVTKATGKTMTAAPKCRQQQLKSAKTRSSTSSTTSGSRDCKLATARSITSRARNSPAIDKKLQSSQAIKGSRVLSPSCKTDANNRSKPTRPTTTTSCGHSPASVRPVRAEPPGASSSSTSSSSLPSLSSSRSISPALVCPHLSLDDIINWTPAAQNNSMVSAHSIGLCANCKLEPPPNVQSPLSPNFRPSTAAAATAIQSGIDSTQSNPRLRRYPDAASGRPPMRRAHSDQQQQRPQNRHHQIGKVACQRTRDDSLDYWLAPGERERLQLSPVISKSVEFIRCNMSEPGRVVRVYKNGQPFDRALRVCFTRGEFTNLTHLLDHINGRQLVPSGARYLFHLDGQLVYSVHELKHAHSYIVSGTRQFDTKANQLLKNRLQSEREAAEQVRLRAAAGCQQRRRRNPMVPSNVARPYAATTSPRFATTTTPGDHTWDFVAHKRRPPQERIAQQQQAEKTISGGGGNMNDRDQAHDNSKKAPPPNRLAHKLRSDSSSSLTTSGRKFGGGGGGASGPAQARRLTRTKSEVGELTLGRKKKSVTFVDTAIGSSLAAIDHTPSQSTGLSSHDEPTYGSARTVGQHSSASLGSRTSGPGEMSSDVQGNKQLVAQVPQVPQVTIDLDASGPPSTSGSPEYQDAAVAPAPGATERVGVAEGSGAPAATLDNSNPGQTEAAATATATAPNGAPDDAADDPQWQYPGGRADSATPTVRPVSQSDPSEFVRARVTTPTPSLSTVDCDDDELGERVAPSSAANGGVIASHHQPAPARVCGRRKKPSKQQANADIWSASRCSGAPLVKGRPFVGLDMPRRNFVLLWVNGFTVNDLYPENCLATPLSSLSSSAAGGTAVDESSGARSISGSAASPATNRIQFKPTDRFNNWLAYSAQSDELLYPAGALVVLWCRKTDEQRFYAQHSASVSALGLCALDRQLAASAQLEAPSGPAIVHLWSLASLATLLVLDDDQFRGKRIFSLRLTFATGRTVDGGGGRQSTSSGSCELAIGARDDKQVWLYAIDCSLVPAGEPSEQQQVERQDNKPRATTDDQQSSSTLMPAGQYQSARVKSLLKANKSIQGSQQPLLVLTLPSLNNSSEATLKQANTTIGSIKNVSEQSPTSFNSKQPTGQKKRQQQQQQTPNSSLHQKVLVSFGRSHLQLWLADVSQSKLRPMQMADGRNPKLIELLGKANCLVRLAPNELLLGDSSGHIHLLLVNRFSPPSIAASHQPAQSRSDRSGASSSDQLLKYRCDLIELLSSSDQFESQEQEAPTAAAAVPVIDEEEKNKKSHHLPSITCLARVSGNLFCSADSSGSIRLWRIQRKRQQQQLTSGTEGHLGCENDETLQFTCKQLICVTLPPDLGLVCAIILAKYERIKATLELYVVSASNSILFCSFKTTEQNDDIRMVPYDCGDDGGANHATKNHRNPASVCVVYEGHETAATSLVADHNLVEKRATSSLVVSQQQQTATTDSTVSTDDTRADGYYFTCSLDCRICKWAGKRLIWKSLLPSPCACIAIHPIGCVLAAGSTDGTVYIMDKVSGLLVSYFPLTPVRINCLAYSRDGLLLAAGCLNGSIFILPVYEQGFKYRKVSIFQSPHPVVSLQFSADNRYMLTSVTHGSYQELILWDLPNFRYMRDNVKLSADKIKWHNSICSGSEDVRAIWENANLTRSQISTNLKINNHNEPTSNSGSRKRVPQTNNNYGHHQQQQASQSQSQTQARKSTVDSNWPTAIVNLSCHRLVRSEPPSSQVDENDQVGVEQDSAATMQSDDNYVIAGDANGYLRLFRYPSYDIQQGFYAIRISSTAINCCRFIDSKEEANFVSTSVDGSICLWKLE